MLDFKHFDKALLIHVNEVTFALIIHWFQDIQLLQGGPLSKLTVRGIKLVIFLLIIPRSWRVGFQDGFQDPLGALIIYLWVRWQLRLLTHKLRQCLFRMLLFPLKLDLSLAVKQFRGGDYRRLRLEAGTDIEVLISLKFISFQLGKLLRMNFTMTLAHFSITFLRLSKFWRLLTYY